MTTPIKRRQLDLLRLSLQFNYDNESFSFIQRSKSVRSPGSGNDLVGFHDIFGKVRCGDSAIADGRQPNGVRAFGSTQPKRGAALCGPIDLGDDDGEFDIDSDGPARAWLFDWRVRELRSATGAWR